MKQNTVLFSLVSSLLSSHIVIGDQISPQHLAAISYLKIRLNVMGAVTLTKLHFRQLLLMERKKAS